MTYDDTLLGLLAIRPMHGYQVLECFQRPQALGRIWKLSTSQLYAVLKRLEREGCITGQAQATEIGPPRVEYALTEAGRARLRRWLDEPSPSPSIRRVRVEFLSRLFIARRLGLPITPIVSAQQAACEQEYARLTRERHQAAADGETLALDFMLAQLEVVIRWIARCEASIQQMPVPITHPLDQEDKR